MTTEITMTRYEYLTHKHRSEFEKFKDSIVKQINEAMTNGCIATYIKDIRRLNDHYGVIYQILDELKAKGFVDAFAKKRYYGEEKQHFMVRLSWDPDNENP